MQNLKTTLLMLFLLSANMFAQGITIGTNTTFTGGSATITCSGNWSNSGTFTAGSSTVLFSGASGNQIITKTAGETFNNITVNKASGDVQLSDNITVNGTLTITSGDLDLNGKTCTLDASASLSETSGNTVKGATGTITTTRNIGVPTNSNIAGLGAEITSTANLGSTTITRGHEAQTGEGNTGIERYFDISPANNAILNATLVFHYDQSEVSGFTESELELFKSDNSGVNWTGMGGSADGTNNKVTLSGIGSFSRWTLSGSSSPLPVELTSFVASTVSATGSGTVVLNWETATEVDNYGFEIARLRPEKDRDFAEAGTQTEAWETIGFVNGHGNSNSPKEYSYIDSDKLSGTINYRLKQIDIDGGFEYSDVVEVEVALPEEYKLFQNYPNPFNPSTTIEYRLPEESFVSMKIYDVLGREIRTLVNLIQHAGNYRIQWKGLNNSGNNVAAGIYIYRITAGNFVATKKMLVIE